ncbi:hypothetical protein XBI1_1260119 [Xenorhabdus bovienii str. Intermedium]|uniref:Uncharacterized protein n=1 Tax=Xenorhabdus bovienii str. Intermedium TaxID=1379677 RepID=A0A077QDC7_XENBV|nr:hypothetical protein XBI1_1260119 [Xenorhabdus bovienii str. Intermedium]
MSDFSRELQTIAKFNYPKSIGTFCKNIPIEQIRIFKK